MSDNCLFCRIAQGEIPSNTVYEDDQVFAFHDISPQAPTHVLVIPKQHIAKLSDVTATERETMGILMERTAHVAQQLGLNGDGYRIIINNGSHGGQEVFHIHVHILGGKRIGPMVCR